MRARWAIACLVLVGCADDGDCLGPGGRASVQPPDLTTNAPSMPEWQLTVEHPLLTDEELASVAASVSLTDESGAAEPVTATASPVSAGTGTLLVSTSAPLADGWHDLHFSLPERRRCGDTWHLGASAVGPSAGALARLRVGSHPFIRAITVCAGDTSRPTTIELDASEPLVLPGGATLVVSQDGEPICDAPLDGDDAPHASCDALRAGAALSLTLPAGITSTSGEPLGGGPGDEPFTPIVELPPTHLGCTRHVLAE